MSACLAALWLVTHSALAGEVPEPTVSAKTDRQVLTAAKGDLLIRRPEAAQARRPVATEPPAVTARGSAARRLVDVAVRDDGIWLNSFATRSMPLDALACAVLSDEIVSHLALPAGAVERLAQEELMRQTRVCAVNGSLLLTCYGGAATVSLRPAQHGDGCSR